MIHFCGPCQNLDFKFQQVVKKRETIYSVEYLL
jgi:hypothetical protein